MLLITLVSLILAVYSYVHVIPHPDKRDKGGEDAFFASSHVLAVADGVGGWNNHGVDPSLYSKTLCKKYSYESTEQVLRSITVRFTIRTNLTNHILGSSTLVLMRLDQLELKVANMGDCRYTIIRNNEVLHQSDEQQHSFNFPFQLGPQGDPAHHAQEFRHSLEVGDIVVVGSDGLYDNLSEDQILQTLKQHNFDEHIARSLAQIAFRYSLSKNYNSPFALRAQQQSIRFQGGKSDDITVIVAKVVLKSEL